METSVPTCATGCPDLDARVLRDRQLAEGGGLVVGISAEGDVGLVMALLVVVCRLRQDPAASARLVTTLPAAHVVRLLRGVLRSRTEASSSAMRTSILRRVLVSRIYGSDDLAAVLDELEGCVPFQRLWSAKEREERGYKEEAEQNKEEDREKEAAIRSSPSVVVFTEMDHHFKWMRLQGGSGSGHGDGSSLRLHEQYGQLLRRLRGLVVLPSSPAATPSAPSTPPPLVLVLNGTFMRRPTNGSGGGGGYEEATTSTAATAEADPNPSPTPLHPDDNSSYPLVLSLLQQPKQQPLEPAVLRLCCDELARVQQVEPRYHGLMNYLCSLHVCCTQLPPVVARLVDANTISPSSSSTSLASGSSSLWVVTVENDEHEISHTTGDRIGVVRFAQGTLNDVLPG